METDGLPKPDNVIFGEIQVLLAEKRTALAGLRTGIAVFALPLSVLSALVAGGTQSFHLSAQQNHSLGNAFVLLRDSCDRPRDGALVDKALKLFVSTQAQQLFAAIGCISLPQIEQNNFE